MHNAGKRSYAACRPRVSMKDAARPGRITLASSVIIGGIESVPRAACQRRSSLGRMSQWRQTQSRQRPALITNRRSRAGEVVRKYGCGLSAPHHLRVVAINEIQELVE